MWVSSLWHYSELGVRTYIILEQIFLLTAFGWRIHCYCDSKTWEFRQCMQSPGSRRGISKVRVIIIQWHTCFCFRLTGLCYIIAAELSCSVPVLLFIAFACLLPPASNHIADVCMPIVLWNVIMGIMCVCACTCTQGEAKVMIPRASVCCIHMGWSQNHLISHSEIIEWHTRDPYSS